MDLILQQRKSKCVYLTEKGRECAREREHGKHFILLTCLPAKVKMYKKMGFRDTGIANSSWGGREWHEMVYVINYSS